jgi:hypothetical protein
MLRKRRLLQAKARQAEFQRFLLQKAVAIVSPLATGLRNIVLAYDF